jgi:hypothetical protein
MNIVDLLQALGPSQRTARIEVTQGGDNPPLTMYLNKGNIIFAKLGDLSGENAVFEALAWQDGVWVSEPVEEADLPAPNNTMPNEAILMEGCRLLDERTKEAPAP